MSRIIQFHIFKGDMQYVAEAVNLPIVTQAQTLDELTGNIQEAVDIHFTDEDVSALGFEENPSVLLNFEIPHRSHA